MTFNDLKTKFLKRWLVVAIFVVVINLLFLPRINQETYVASIALGLNPSGTQIDSTLNAGNNSEGYASVLEQLSQYISNRFSSIEIQSKIADELGIQSNYKIESPIYTVVPQQAGFVSLSYTDPNRETAEKFITASKTAYKRIIAEWNSSRPSIFLVQPMTEFNESINVTSPSRQFQLLPLIAGLLTGFAVIFTIPLKKTKNSK